MKVSVESGKLKKIVFLSSIIYIYIPILIFLFGFEKIWFAGLTTGVCFFCFYRSVKEIKQDWSSQKNLDIPVWTIVICLIFLLIVSYFAGWGAATRQATDWCKHNAILRDLVNRKWPVYYTNGNEKSMLVYYVGGYMFPALIGKTFGSFRVAEIVLTVYNYIGLFLVVVNLWIVVKAKTTKKMFFACWMLVNFSGVLVLRYLFTNFYPKGAYMDSHWLIRYKMINLQLRPNFITLRWGFQQFIVPMIALLLFWQYREKVKHYVFIMLPTMMYGILSFAGTAVISFAYAIFMWAKKEIHLKKIISIENILGAMVLGGNMIIYFYGNIFSEKPKEIGAHIVNYSSYIWIYFAFIFIEFGIYVLLLWRQYHKEPLFIFSTVLLCILPMFFMGAYNDLLIGVSIIPFNVLLIYVLKFLFDKETWEIRIRKVKAVILLVFLFLSLWQIFGEIFMIILMGTEDEIRRVDKWKTLEVNANRKNKGALDWKYNYYDYDYENNIFYKYIAREKD